MKAKPTVRKAAETVTMPRVDAMRLRDAAAMLVSVAELVGLDTDNDDVTAVYDRVALLCETRTSLQKRGTELVEENRALRRQLGARR